MKNLLILVIAVMFIAPGAARMVQAAPVIFFGQDSGNGEFDRLTPSQRVNANTAQADFLSSLIDPKTEGFESFNFLDSPPPPLSLKFGTGGTLANLMTPIGAFGFVNEETSSTGAYLGRYPITGTKYFDVTSAFDLPNDAFSVTFLQPQAAVGFFATDVGDETVPLFPRPDLDLILERSSGSPLAVDISHFIDPNASGAALFWGVTDLDDRFTGITFRNASSNDGFGIDDLTIAVNAVPEPNTLLLLSTGLTVGALVMWRKRRIVPRKWGRC